jgi:hypothetical protein
MYVHVRLEAATDPCYSTYDNPQVNQTNPLTVLDDTDVKAVPVEGLEV